MQALGSGNAGALAALFLIVVLTEAGIPFPFILDSAIFLSVYTYGPISWPALHVVLVVFLGRQAGAAAVYWLARLVGGTLVNKLASRFTSVRHGLSKLKSATASSVYLVVAMSRLTSLLTLSSAASGVISVPFRSFAAGVALSALIFDGGLVLLGFATKHWFRFMNFNPSPWAVILGLVGLIILFWVGRFLFLRRNKAEG